MLKSKSVIPLVIGLAVGFYAVKLGVDLVRRAQAANAGTTYEIASVTELVPVGSNITRDVLKLVTVPKALVPPGSFQSLEEVVDRVSTLSLRPGSFVTDSALAPEGTQPGLSMKVPKGYRAVAVKVDEYTSVGGFLNPGSWVDVIAVIKTKSGNRRETISRTILEGIQIAAVGQEIADPNNPDAKITRSVTMLIKPKDTALLHLAANQGLIRLALRHQNDEQEGEQGYASETGMLDADWQPDQGDPKKNSPYANPGEWWSGLAGGLITRVVMGAATAPVPDYEPQPVEMAALPVVDAPAFQPWTVTVLHGAQEEEWVFASDASRDLLNTPSSMSAKRQRGKRTGSGNNVASDASGGGGPQVGARFELSFTGTNGERFDMGRMNGKVVLVDFWASWCGPCVASVPQIKAAYDKYHDKGLEIVGINLDKDRVALMQFVSDYDLPWPQYFDGQGWNNKWARKFAVKSIPTLYLIDKNGNLRDTNARDHLEQGIVELLGE